MCVAYVGVYEYLLTGPHLFSASPATALSIKQALRRANMRQKPSTLEIATW